MQRTSPAGRPNKRPPLFILLLAASVGLGGCADYVDGELRYPRKFCGILYACTEADYDIDYPDPLEEYEEEYRDRDEGRREREEDAPTPSPSPSPGTPPP